MGKRILVYDRTCVSPRTKLGLTTIWRSGAALYRGAGRIDDVYGVADWAEAARCIDDATKHQGLEQIQYWGHGNFGLVRAGNDRLDERSLDSRSPARFFAVVRERMIPSPRALVWFRTCEAFGAHVGQRFARLMADYLAVPVAGHTHIIDFWQSGLQGLMPGARPAWSPLEGVAEGTAESPRKGAWSSPLAPRTIHALEGGVPWSWFSRTVSPATSS